MLFGETSFWEMVTIVLEAGAGQQKVSRLAARAESSAALLRGNSRAESELVRIKAAIWGVANAATSPAASESCH